LSRGEAWITKKKRLCWTSPIARVGPEALRQGRPYKLTPTKLRNSINKYFEWCESDDVIPSIKGLCIFCKIYRDTFYKYIAKEVYSDIIEQAKMIISNWIETDIYNTRGIAAGKISYAKNVHGWSDKLETNNTTEVRQITVQEATAKIEMLAPKLLELLRNTNITNQMGRKAKGEQAVVNAEVVKENDSLRRI
jgi:hypothetical protein